MIAQILARIEGFLPAGSEGVLAVLEGQLRSLAAHGDTEALPRLADHVEQIAAAIEAGDGERTLKLLNEWGITASLLSLMGLDIDAILAGAHQDDQAEAQLVSDQKKR